MRRYARTDANHAEIMRALLRVGCRVVDLSDVGGGTPDLLVRDLAGNVRLLEVKDGSKPPSARKLTPAQVAFHAEWPVTVVESVDAALQAVGVRRIGADETSPVIADAVLSSGGDRCDRSPSLPPLDSPPGRAARVTGRIRSPRRPGV